jgi:hypothetical protein
MKWMDYRRPEDAPEVLTFLEQTQERGRIIADVTNLILHPFTPSPLRYFTATTGLRWGIVRVFLSILDSR